MVYSKLYMAQTTADNCGHTNIFNIQINNYSNFNILDSRGSSWLIIKNMLTIFFINRCADLMSGVTKVLRSVGVNCCTVQPEFVSCSCDASPVVPVEEPFMPHRLACRLACPKACAGSMCCSPLEEESRILLTPPAGETKEEPPTLVMENTFLKKNIWIIWYQCASMIMLYGDNGCRLSQHIAFSLWINALLVFLILTWCRTKGSMQGSKQQKETTILCSSTQHTWNSNARTLRIDQ